MAEEPVWEVARLVAALDPSIPERLQAMHPAAGWCPACHAVAPCSSRRLADLAARQVPGLRAAGRASAEPPP